jgi:head-tail adaptor
VTRRARLSRRLVLEEPTRLPDGSGGHATVWRPLGALWADVAARSGREDFVAAQARPRVTYSILVRGVPVGAPSRPRPEQRLREGTRVFDILTVAEADGSGRYLEILAQEGVQP